MASKYRQGGYPSCSFLFVATLSLSRKQILILAHWLILAISSKANTSCAGWLATVALDLSIVARANCDEQMSETIGRCECDGATCQTANSPVSTMQTGHVDPCSSLDLVHVWQSW